VKYFFVFCLVVSSFSFSALGQSNAFALVQPNSSITAHSFFDRRNLQLQSTNAIAQTVSLFAIQGHDDGGQMAPCDKPGPCTGALEARGRTLDPFEKHFQSYGYGWGAAYVYGGGVGLNMFVAYMFHAGGHHKLERWVPIIAIGHAQASTGYALTGSKQGKNGW
jgi:hypothetical protein